MTAMTIETIRTLGVRSLATGTSPDAAARTDGGSWSAPSQHAVASDQRMMIGGPMSPPSMRTERLNRKLPSAAATVPRATPAATRLPSSSPRQASRSATSTRSAVASISQRCAATCVHPAGGVAGSVTRPMSITTITAAATRRSASRRASALSHWRCRPMALASATPRTTCATAPAPAAMMGAAGGEPVSATLASHASAASAASAVPVPIAANSMRRVPRVPRVAERAANEAMLVWARKSTPASA